MTASLDGVKPSTAKAKRTLITRITNRETFRNAACGRCIFIVIRTNRNRSHQLIKIMG